MSTTVERLWASTSPHGAIMDQQASCIHEMSCGDGGNDNDGVACYVGRLVSFHRAGLQGSFGG